MSTTPSILAIFAAAERRVIDSLRNAGAVTPMAAVQRFELGDIPEGRFHRLIEAGVIREVGKGRYFLDEPSLENFRAARRQRALVLLVFWLLLLGLSVFLLTV